MKILTKLNIKKICTFFGLVFLTSCSTSDIPPKELEERQGLMEERQGLMYEANSQIPYSGLIKRHFRNGQTKFIGNYIDGKSEGQWEYYFKNGQLEAIGDYKDGKKEGFWSFYREDGGKVRVQYYVDDRNVWVSKTLRPKDVVVRNGITYQINEKNPFYGTINVYWVNMIGDELSLRVRHTYLNGRISGNMTSYHRNGQVESKGYAKDGKKEGLWECYYKNGQLESKGNYIDGKLNGLIEFYYENGQLDVTGNMIDDKREGFWESYKSGLLWGQGNYKDDKREGVWIFFDGNGQLNNKMTYVKGKPQRNYWSLGGTKRYPSC